MNASENERCEEDLILLNEDSQTLRQRCGHLLWRVDKLR